MGKYMITLETEAPTAAEAVARVSIDVDGEYITEWTRISVEPVVPKSFASGGYVVPNVGTYGTK